MLEKKKSSDYKKHEFISVTPISHCSQSPPPPIISPQDEDAYDDCSYPVGGVSILMQDKNQSIAINQFKTSNPPTNNVSFQKPSIQPQFANQYEQSYLDADSQYSLVDSPYR